MAGSMTAIPPSTDTKDALIVAIDFGTTYSGVAWASARDRTIKTIKAWPGQPGQMEKVKTELTYKEGTNRVQKWGFEVTEHTPNALRWFKLLLQNPDCDLLSNEPSGVDATQREQKLRRLRETLDLIPEGKRPQDVVADYLRVLHGQLKIRLQKTYKKVTLEQFGKDIPVLYYLTVPAMWSPSAKHMTREAAKAAGLEEWGPVRLLSEPEAAAAHCFMEYDGTKDALKVNDVFVIVDCGGGTVDIISYEIKSTSPLKVEEVAVGTGGLYGSVFLNDRFEALVRNKIGERAFEDMSRENREEMLSYFDNHLKKTFRENKPKASERWPTDDSNDGYTDDDDDEEEDEEPFFPCPVPGVPDDEEASVLTESLHLTKAEVKSIFEPIFEGIRDLVQSQVDEAERNSNKAVTALMLVGGFGSSDYLHEYLTANVKSGLSHNMSILQAPEGWQAIVQGAVQHGLSLHRLKAQDPDMGDRVDSAMVDTRKARESYGVSVAESYKPDIHPKEKVEFNILLGGMICPRRMQWFVMKGQDLKGKKKIEDIASVMPAACESERSIEILRSAADVPPADEEDDSVVPFTSFPMDLSNVAKEPHFPLAFLFSPMSLEDRFVRCSYTLFMKLTESHEFVFWAEAADGTVIGQSQSVKAT